MQHCSPVFKMANLKIIFIFLQIKLYISGLCKFMNKHIVRTVFIATAVTFLSSCNTTNNDISTKSDCINNYTYDCFLAKKTRLTSTHTMKRMSEAFGVYLDNSINRKHRERESIQLLRKIKPKDDFEVATIAKRIGEMYLVAPVALTENNTKYALMNLEKAKSLKILSAKDQKDILRTLINIYSMNGDVDNSSKTAKEFELFTGEKFE